jgi:hypothetical protein
LTVCDWLVCLSAKVDEVVFGRDRGDLASFFCRLSILLKTLGDDRRIKSERRLYIAATATATITTVALAAFPTSRCIVSSRTPRLNSTIKPQNGILRKDSFTFEPAPVAFIRASRSAAVVQATEVPALLTKGRAAQLHGRGEKLVASQRWRMNGLTLSQNRMG